MLRSMFVGIFMSLLGVPAFAALAIFQPFSWITPILWVAIACFLLLMVLIPKLCWQAFHSCTKVDRSSGVVEVRKGKVKTTHDLGNFKRIVLQAVIVPRSATQYHAYLVGEKGRCHLEIISESIKELRSKLKLVAEFLEIPIEDVAEIGSLASVLNR
jgi:hypothetical protein